MPYTKHPYYDSLPEPLKEAYTEEEYAWMSDEQRNSLEEEECNPEDD